MNIQISKILLAALLSLSILLTACASGDNADLAGGWELTEMTGYDNVSGVWIDFKDGKISGRSGCNSISGDYKVQGNKLSFGPIASTMMACEQPFMQIEEGFLAAISTADTFSINEIGLLTIDYDGGMLVFRSAAE